VNSQHRQDGILEMNLAWVYLILAGLLEVGWPVGLQLSQNSARAIWALPLAIICMAASGFFLLLALKNNIPMGTAYAVWTGIGAAGTFFVGIYAFEESAGIMRFVGVACIIAGVAVLKLSH